MKTILKAISLTIAGAFLVSWLKSSQALLALLLGVVLIIHLLRVAYRMRRWQAVVRESFHLVTFGTIGFLTESWGTHNEHWTYYHLPEGQNVPIWVPLAWAIAALLLGKSEEALQAWQAQKKPPIHGTQQLASFYFLGMLLPLIGESICIAFGVWEYHWPFKILGVPLLALVLIAYAHYVFRLIRAGGARNQPA